jgi:hypothetical protein
MFPYSLSNSRFVFKSLEPSLLDLDQKFQDLVNFVKNHPKLVSRGNVLWIYGNSLNLEKADLFAGLEVVGYSNELLSDIVCADFDARIVFQTKIQTNATISRSFLQDTLHLNWQEMHRRGLKVGNSFWINFAINSNLDKTEIDATLLFERENVLFGLSATDN